MIHLNYREGKSSEEMVIERAFEGGYNVPFDLDKVEKIYNKYLDNLQELEANLAESAGDVSESSWEMFLEGAESTIHLYRIFKSMRERFENLGLTVHCNDVEMTKLFSVMYGHRSAMVSIISEIVHEVQQNFREDLNGVPEHRFDDAISDICAYIESMVENAVSVKLPNVDVDVIDFIGKVLYHGVAAHINTKGEVIYLKTEIVRNNPSDMNVANEWDERCREFSPVVSFNRGILFTMIVERFIELVSNKSVVIPNDEVLALAGVSHTSVDAGPNNLIQILNQHYVKTENRVMAVGTITQSLRGDLFLAGDSKED